MSNLLWSGRFSKPTDALAHELNASLSVDKRLWREDIQGSVAWALALAQAQVIAPAESVVLVGGLEQVYQEFEREAFIFHPGDEDIHTAVERRLTELVGPVGGKLHTGRSRNDQVVTDFRLWMLNALAALTTYLRDLQTALLERAEPEVDTPMPGYTHTQRAQPISLAHWLLSHAWPLQRDVERLRDLRARVAVLPLGAGALAGTAFAVDRAALAVSLGFDHPAPNSLDAVSDRDFVAEWLFCAALVGSHLSRLAEALILFSTAEFGFVQVDDAYATGSSLMPQKKNPDMLELARGKAGTLLGLLTGLMATLKGLPSAYDKDLQEDKSAAFAAFDTLMQVVPVTAGVVRTLTFDRARMSAALSASLFATELADELVRRGLPFREAHHVAGRAVKLAESRGVPLNALSVADLHSLSPLFTPDVHACFEVARALAHRATVGGTAPAAVQAQMAALREHLQTT